MTSRHGQWWPRPGRLSSFGPSSTGTELGIRRAEQLAERVELAEEDIVSMHGRFPRHAEDKDGKANQWASDRGASAGCNAWLLWGGSNGKWAECRTAKLSDEAG